MVSLREQELLALRGLHIFLETLQGSRARSPSSRPFPCRGAPLCTGPSSQICAPSCSPTQQARHSSACHKPGDPLPLWLFGGGSLWEHLPAGV